MPRRSKRFYKKVKEILDDGNLSYGEAVDTFIFDCYKDGVSDQKDNLAQCTQASPILGRAIDVLKKHGMLLDQGQGDAVILDDGARQLTENGDVDGAIVCLRNAFALSDDISFKQSILKKLGALYLSKTFDPDISNKERSRLLLLAQRASEDAVNVDPQSDGDVVFAAHYNLGQIYFLQYQMLREKNPDNASQVLAKAVEQFQKVVDHDPNDMDAKGRLDACQASVRGQGLVKKVQTLLKKLPKKTAEAKKSHAIVQFIASQKGDVAQNVNDFLQAAINYKVDAGDEQGSVKEIHTVQVEWIPPANGGPPFREIPGTEKVWKADLVLLALGFLGPEETMLGQLGIERDARSNAKAEFEEYATNVKGVFAAGDMRRGQSLIVWAINEGRGAARECDRYLMGSTSLP